MPENIEGASAVADPSRENVTPDPSFLDSMVDNMAANEATKIQPGETPAPKTEAPEPVVEETPKAEAKAETKTEPETEPDDFGLSKLIPKKKPAETPVTPPKQDPKQVKAAADDKISWEKAPQKLREAFQTAKTRAEELEAKVAALTKEKEELAKKPAPPELEARWKADLENEKKRAEAAEENLRIVGYEKSPDFTNEHIKPLEKAWNDALESFVDQEIEVQGVPKKIAAEDIQSVVAIDNQLQAARKARELFGEDAAPILQARDRIRTLQAKRDEALETWQTKGTEYQQRQAQEQNELRSNAVQTFKDTISGYETRLPEILKPENDAEKTAKEAAEKLIRMAFLEEGVPTFQNKAEGVKFAAKIKADICARALAAPVMIIRNNALKEQVAELQAKLKGYETSEPTVGNKGDGEGRKAPRKESAESGGLAGMLAAIDAAPAFGG